jgi:hypothetical protein
VMAAFDALVREIRPELFTERDALLHEMREVRAALDRAMLRLRLPVLR